MRIIALVGAGAALFCIAGTAQAAGWCSGAGECGFRSHAQCAHTVGAGGGCHKPVAARGSPSGYHAHGAGAVSAGPAWKSPYECYTDEGYGRYTRCSAGGNR